MNTQDHGQKHSAVRKSAVYVAKVLLCDNTGSLSPVPFVQTFFLLHMTHGENYIRVSSLEQGCAFLFHKCAAYSIVHNG